MKRDELIKAIREQQIECSAHLYIELLTEKEIEKLLEEGNYFYVEKDNKILVALYLKRFSNQDKIYRLGGFTVANIENPSFLTKKEVTKLLAKVKEYISKHNINFIGETNKISSFESYYIGFGAKKLSFKECLEQYPLFLKLFIDGVTDKEFLKSLKSKTFYVREANI